MVKRIIIFLLCIALVPVMIVGCKEDEKVDNNEVKLAELQFEYVDISSIENESLKDWVQQNYKTEGVFAYANDSHKYVLLGAGAQNTGGYFVEITSVIGRENDIVINGVLITPNKDDDVTTAITYPYTCIKIVDDGRNVVIGSFDKQEKTKKVSSGTENNSNNEQNNEEVPIKGIYVGQGDSNSVEIIVNDEARAYRLSNEVKPIIENGVIKDGDVILFTYEENEYGQLIIKTIETLDKMQVTKGIYVGQIDGNSVEIIVNDEARAYRLSDEVKPIIENGVIKDGDPVLFTYEENEYGQFIIKHIEKDASK